MSTQRYPIDERWSPALASRGWSAVPSVFLNLYSQLDIKPTEAMLIIHLMSYKWDSRKPFPSVRSLCAKLGLSDSQVRALLRRLEKKRLLKRIQRTGRSNEFDLSPLIDALEAAMESEGATPVEAESTDDWDVRFDDTAGIGNVKGGVS